MMEEVYPVALALGIAGSGVSMRGRAETSSGSVTGHITKELGEGRFVATLPSGETLEVTGRRGLSEGDKVRVVLKGRVGDVRAADPGTGPAGEPPGMPRPQALMTAMIPLLFGGDGAAAKLEVFSSGDGASKRSRDRAVTFVFEVTTRALGLLQWVVHLRGREVALQAHARDASRKDLVDWASRIEGSLRERGFSLSAPTVLLKKPFRVPAGTLSVRG